MLWPQRSLATVNGERGPLSPIRFIMMRYRYRQTKDAHTLICTHRHTDVCICTHRNKTACMHACTHLCMCIQGHIHMDKLFILLKVSSTFPLQSQIGSPMRCAEMTDSKVYRVFTSERPPLASISSYNQQVQSSPAQRSGLINLRQVRW